MANLPAGSFVYKGVNGMEKAILIVDEVAELLRVDRQRVYELVRTKHLPVIRLGQRQYRFDADAIHRWLNAGGNRDGGGEHASGIVGET